MYVDGEMPRTVIVLTSADLASRLLTIFLKCLCIVQHSRGSSSDVIQLTIKWLSQKGAKMAVWELFCFSQTCVHAHVICYMVGCAFMLLQCNHLWWWWMIVMVDLVILVNYLFYRRRYVLSSLWYYFGAQLCAGGCVDMWWVTQCFCPSDTCTSQM